MSGIDLLFDAPAGQKSHSRLDSAIYRSPEDPDSYSVYADWLQTQGDPRSELIAVQRLRIDRPQDPELAQAEAQLLHDHWDHLMGPLGAYGDDLTLRWFCGFLQYARIDARRFHGMATAELLRTLVSSMSGRFLRELAIGDIQPSPSDDGYYQDIIEVLDETRQPPTLKSLTLGSSADPAALSARGVGDVEVLGRVFPDLERLAVHGRDVELGRFHVPGLRSLAVVCGGMSWRVIESLARHAWPRLERLNLWIGAADLGASVTPDRLLYLLTHDRFPALKHLAIMQYEQINELIPSLARAHLARQLETLGLAMGTMTDSGALALVNAADQFESLRFLNVSMNYLSDEARLLLSKVVPVVSTAPQADPSAGPLRAYVMR